MTMKGMNIMFYIFFKNTNTVEVSHVDMWMYML